MSPAEAKPVLDLIRAKHSRSNYRTSIPNKRPRYDAGASNSAIRQGRQIAQQLNEIDTTQSTEQSEQEEEGGEGEEGEEEEEEELDNYKEDNNWENINDYFADESDSDFEVDPQPEVKWRDVFQSDIDRNSGHNYRHLLPRTDGEFAHRYIKLKQGVCEWAFKYFCVGQIEGEDRFNLASLREHRALISHIDLIAAVSGPNITWADTIQTMRPRIVMGIIMKAIQHLIFGEPLFGATKAQTAIMNKIDDLRTLYDAGSWRPSLFRRQKIRASIIDSFYPVNSELPEALCSGLLVAMTKIYFLLKPLGKPVGTNPRGHHANRQAHSLGYLLLEAARLHFDMRREPDTVYCLYSKRPGKVVDLDHVSCEVPRLPMYDKPEQGKPKLRLHVVLAPGIIALQKFIIKEKKFRVRVIAPILAAAEWVNDDQLNRALKLSENIW